MTDSFGARSMFEIGGANYQIYRLDAVREGHVDRLPYSLKILLENLLRHEDGRDVSRDDILALANWDPKAAPSTEISFTPSRVILQDFTGVPAVVDLAAMRDAMKHHCVETRIGQHNLEPRARRGIARHHGIDVHDQ